PAPHLVAHDTIRSTENPVTKPEAPENPSDTAAAPRQSLHELRRRKIVALALVLILGGAAAGAVYGIGAFKRNAADAGCADAVAPAQRVARLGGGEVAAFVAADGPLRLPNVAFRDGEGRERHLSDWHGRTVLLNLWATWCVPCRKEMPALEALQQKQGGGN